MHQGGSAPQEATRVSGKYLFIAFLSEVVEDVGSNRRHPACRRSVTELTPAQLINSRNARKQ